LPVIDRIAIWRHRFERSARAIWLGPGSLWVGGQSFTGSGSRSQSTASDLRLIAGRPDLQASLRQPPRVLTVNDV